MLECGFLLPTMFVHASLKINSKNVNARVHCEEFFVCCCMSKHMCLSVPVCLLTSSYHLLQCWYVHCGITSPGSRSWKDLLEVVGLSPVCLCTFAYIPFTLWLTSTKQNVINTRLIIKNFWAIKINTNSFTAENLSQKTNVMEIIKKVKIDEHINRWMDFTLGNRNLGF